MPDTYSAHPACPTKSNGSVGKFVHLRNWKYFFLLFTSTSTFTKQRRIGRAFSNLTAKDGGLLLELWMVHIREETPPAGETPLEWLLLSTIAVTSNRIAEQCIRWYRLRWRIEDWHRVLKSGCGTEKLTYRTAERLRRGIVINMVIAWRIMLMTLLGRECPELPAEVLFSDLEIEVLSAHAVKKTVTHPRNWERPYNL